MLNVLWQCNSTFSHKCYSHSRQTRIFKCLTTIRHCGVHLQI